jgi:serine phosphatase RsbU (regulator of sigma subunit)
VISRERARDRSEETTRVLRQSLLPSALPSIPDCELAVRFSPAHEGELVGGDFYDVFPAGPSQWALVVGDVCGKGSDAAAITAMARWTLRSQAMSGAGPVEALRFLNRAMLTLDLKGRFITVAYLMLTLDGSRAQASLACAGHPPGILVTSRGEARSLPARGTLLGIWPDIRLEESEFALGHGDSIVLYTDGVSDTGPGPERPPAEALRSRPPGGTADQLADALQAHAREPGRPQRDDIAIVALRFMNGRRDRSGGGDRPPAMVRSAAGPPALVI